MPSRLKTSHLKPPALGAVRLKHVVPGDAGLDLSISTKEEITKTEFDPVVNAVMGKGSTAEGSVVQVTWISIGIGERRPKAKLTKAQRLEQRHEKEQKNRKGLA